MATVALFVAGISLLVALAALVWQIVKHFLDGGRVKVYLNTAVLEPEFMIATNLSGRFAYRGKDNGRSVTYGRALELAQLVVENPGKVPVTVYSPGLYYKGADRTKHRVTPRMISTEETLGADRAITDMVVRIEPYDRVTFLLDYWSVVPSAFKDNDLEEIHLRGYVGVAGRTKRPQLSSRKLRWRIKRGAYTAIEGTPEFTPYAVIWREMYRRLPAHGTDPDWPGGAPIRITKGSVGYMLKSAMSRFDERPSIDDFETALLDIAKEDGERFSTLGLHVYEAYEALDLMEGNLTEWTEGLYRRDGSERGAPEDEDPSPKEAEQGEDGS